MEKLIQSFPKLSKPNYELLNNLTKNTCLFIPKGPKMFAWFTYYNNKCVCMFYNQEKIKMFNSLVCFKEELSLGKGTILYGTLIDNNFVCDTIYLYKNENVGGNFMTKLNIIKNILVTSIKDSDLPGSISFKLPQMSNNKFILECSNLPYQVYGILQINENRPKIYILHNLFGQFNIKKDYSLEDVYNLYTSNENNELTLYTTALVNDFKTSNLLKSLFSIKNNYKNIEFSDSDDDSEHEFNESNDTNEIYVNCIYIHEYKKWKPYSKSNSKSKSETIDSLKNIILKEKKNIAL